MPPRRLRYAAAAAAAAALPALFPAPVGAQQSAKLACIEASDRAQKLRAAGKLAQASHVLRSCVLDECPGPVREACTQWIGEVNASMPSVVIGARDADGRDIVDLKVSIDGALVVEHLGGRALPVDPGRHMMRYERADGVVVNEEVLVREGEKNRPLTVTFPGVKTPVAPVPAPVAATAEVPTGKTASTGNTVAGIVLAGVGAAALGTALGLDLTTTSKVEADASATGCSAGGKKSCPASEVNALQLDYDLAGVALGVGIVAVGAATYILLAHPFGTPAKAPGAAFRIVPSPRGFAIAF